MKIHQTELEVIRASVLEQSADAIINAANTGMRGGGALDGAIHRAAGREMLRELESLAPHGAQTAEVVVTGAYDLPQRFVFHVAGPIWKSNRELECDELLSASYRNCLIQADARELESLAFPSLSTGVFSFPIERAAPLALQTVVDYLKSHPQTKLKRVMFTMFGGPEHHEFRRALTKLEIRNDN